MLHVDNELIPNKTVKFQGKKWIPLDPTAIDQGFAHAWDVAYDFFQRKETEKIVSSLEATSRFSPILFNHKEIKVKLNENYGQYVMETVNKLFPKDLDKKELPAVAINSMGIQAAKKGDFLTAELYFNQAKEKGMKSAYYNLMVLYNKTKNFEKAKDVYNKYVNHFALDKKMTTLIAKTYYSMELERRKKLKMALSTKADSGIFNSQIFFVNKLFYNNWVHEELKKLKDLKAGEEPEFNWFE
jgi:tetratricopeptide (TPR) repeat protein